MEEVSAAAFWVSLILCAAATAAAWAPLAPFRLGLVGPVLAHPAAAGTDGAPTEGTDRKPDGSPASAIAERLGRAVLFALLLSIGARWLAAGHPPLASLREFTVAFAAAVCGFQAFLDGRAGASAARVLVQPFALLLLALAAILPSKIEPLAPALRSQDILVAHVSVLLAAYAALTVSFAAALLQLWQSSTHASERLPAARVMDAVAYRAVSVGFPLLALGIALGAYWASTAWGRYWGWDPKETSSLVTWLAYGAYFHLHSTRGWSGRRSALVLVAAYGCVLFSYFAVDLLAAGLHSYGGG